MKSNVFVSVHSIKTKIISSMYLNTFEKNVNDFISTHIVKDIKYAPVATEHMVYHNAIIIYEGGNSDDI